MVSVPQKPVVRRAKPGLSAAVAAHRGDQEAEQQRAGHVDREGRPGPGAGAVRGGLGQADPGQGADDAADVDRREAAPGRI